MGNKQYITITGLKHYYGQKPFKIDHIIRLVKEADNKFDETAIRAELPFIGTIGYVANSPHTVYAGTLSASQACQHMQKTAYAKIKFLTHTSAIAIILSSKKLKKILEEQKY